MTIDIKAMLEKHLRWLRSEPEGERANLEGANLRGAYLEGAKFDQDTLITLCPLSLNGLMWSVVITDEIMCIGCQRHRIDEWDAFDGLTIARMAGNALSWWREHKPLVMGLARFHQAKCKAEAAHVVAA
jgi:hypothetical protein